MKKILALLLPLTLAAGIAHASDTQVVNVAFVHQAIQAHWGVNVPIVATNHSQIANRRYVLCAVHRANLLLGRTTTNWCNHALAADTDNNGRVAMNRVATLDAIARLIPPRPTSRWDLPGSIPPLPPHTVLEVFNHSFNGATVATHGTGINGSPQQRALPAGTWLIEVWGADGGGRLNPANVIDGGGGMRRGGYGGFSRGILTITAAQTVHIYVGGAGGSYGLEANGTNHPGGWNGGGGIRQGSGAGGLRMGTGGGASDVRTTGGAWNAAASLNTRFIVAGGGGGEAGWTGTGNAHEWCMWGGNGGGPTAQPAHHPCPGFNQRNGGHPGTQIDSPRTGHGMNNPTTEQVAAGNAPGFGIGGNNGTAASNPCGNQIRAGGGGGWWGGMSGCQGAGGGGSGFVRGLNQGGQHLSTAPAWATLTSGGNGQHNWENVPPRPATAGRHGHVRISRIQLN